MKQNTTECFMLTIKTNNIMVFEDEYDYKFMKMVDFRDETIKEYHIDTRDFYCSTSKVDSGRVPDLSKVNNYPLRFFHTPEEVMVTLDRLFQESGGNVKWRHLALTGEGARVTNNWNLKYIKIYRTEHGMIACNRDNFVLSKSILACPVEQEYLNSY
jgi:hypothetical protein